MGNDPFDIFDEVFRAIEPVKPPVTLVVAEEVSAKMARNLDLALERQGQLLAKPVNDEMDPRERRLVADVSHQVVKAAIGVDDNRLRARADDGMMARIRLLIEQEQKKLAEERGYIDADLSDDQP